MENARLYQDILDELNPPSIAEQFFQQTKFLKPAVAPPHENWPESWRKIHYKSYPRLPRILLPDPVPALTEPSFFKVLSGRQTCRYFADKAVSLTTLSTLLQYSVGLQNRSKVDEEFCRRMYPSGGARYPVEVYLIVNCDGEIPTGVYHYHFRTHSLEQICQKSVQANLRDCYGDKWVQEAPYQLCLSAVFYRNEVKYKDRGLRLSFLEAGHISQNVYLASSTLGLGCSALGGFVEDKIHEVLGIDGEQEGIVHALAFGYSNEK